MAALGAMCLAIAVAGSACGGGDGADPGAGKGEGVKDPATVPSSTPIREPILFKITGDTISATGADGAATVPSSGTPVNQKKTYVVKSGDTCGAIATSQGITLDQLLKANRTIDAGCTNIHAGDVLQIPQPTSSTTISGGGATPVPGGAATPKPSGKDYVVKSGDTCGAIAASYGVDASKLISLNGLDPNCQNLQVGQSLKIPQ